MHNNRILFVLKYRETPAGAEESWGDGSGHFLHSGLYNSAKFVSDMLNDIGIPSSIVHLEDNNKIHKAIVDFRATHCIIEAFWVVPDKIDELIKVCPNVKFIVRNHSETPFLANEGVAFDWMLEYIGKKNTYLSCNAPRMLDETKFLTSLEHPDWSDAFIDEKIFFLPNYYPLSRRQHYNKLLNKKHVDVGCFGAVRPLKNHLIQAVAALKFATMNNKRLNFHINGSRVEGGGQAILKNLREIFNHFNGFHTLVEHPWAPHREFRQLVAQMDLVTQVSFSETYNIVAADAVSVGVPIVVSPEVPWVSDDAQADPNDSDDIAKRMNHVYHNKHKFFDWDPNREHLERYNANCVKIWSKHFG